MSCGDTSDAKAKGGKWDRAMKKWYAPTGEKRLVEQWEKEPRTLMALDGEDRTWGGDALSVEFQPNTSWCKTVQHAIHHTDRERVQNFVFGRTNRTCETCGIQDVELDFHIHGRWMFGDGTQRLMRLMALCERCYKCTQFSTVHDDNGPRREVVAHLQKVLCKGDAECRAHIGSASKSLTRLNNHEWTIDLSLLRQNGIRCETEASSSNKRVVSLSRRGNIRKSTALEKKIQHRAELST